VLRQAQGVQLFAQVVLDGFDVVLNLDFVRLDLGGLRLVEVFDPAAQGRNLVGAERGDVRDLRARGHEDQPLDLDGHAVLQEAVLRHVHGERAHDGGVTLVQRAHDAGGGGGGADQVLGGGIAHEDAGSCLSGARGARRTAGSERGSKKQRNSAGLLTLRGFASSADHDPCRAGRPAGVRVSAARCSRQRGRAPGGAGGCRGWR